MTEYTTDERPNLIDSNSKEKLKREYLIAKFVPKFESENPNILLERAIASILRDADRKGIDFISELTYLEVTRENNYSGDGIVVCGMAYRQIPS